MFIPFIIFGVAMILSGVYVLKTKNVFGKRDPWPSIVKALNLSENAVKGISIAYSIIAILIGIYTLICVFRYPDLDSYLAGLNSFNITAQRQK